VSHSVDLYSSFCFSLLKSWKLLLARMPDSSLAQRKVSGVVLSSTRPVLPPNLPMCSEITNTSRNRALLGEGKKIEMICPIREFDFRLLPAKAKRVVKSLDLRMHQQRREQILFDYWLPEILFQQLLHSWQVPPPKRRVIAMNFDLLYSIGIRSI
jgi:hypothetical protein